MVFRFDRNNTEVKSTEINHSSAIKHSDHVSTYIQTEIQYGAIYGPFANPPFDCHILPY